MTKRRTKRAFLASLLSMMLCVSMLIGSTFAWFTDNATTNVNTIQAGTLDIQLLDGNSTDAKSLEGETLSFMKAGEAPVGEEILFEPGAEYTMQQAWLYNAGNLHAKYQVVITGIDGDPDLARVLDVYETVEGKKVNCGTLAKVIAEGGVIKTNTIAPEAFDSFGTISLKMQEDAGNEYQGKSLEGVAITVQATQAAVEYDSNNNSYDEKAGFDKFVSVTSQEELKEAISYAKDHTTIELSNDIYYLTGSMREKNLVFKGSEDVVIDTTKGIGNTNNATLTFDGVTVKFGDNNYKGFQHAKKIVYRDSTIEGLQFMYAEDVEFIDCTFVNEDDYCVWTYGAKNVIFTDCTFKTGGKAVLVYIEGEHHANITLNHCTFNSDGSLADDKAAVEVGSSPSSAATTYNIFLNDCTADGFAANKSTSPLWGNKNSMDTDHLNVLIDGNDVY